MLQIDMLICFEGQGLNGIFLEASGKSGNEFCNRLSIVRAIMNLVEF